MFRTGIRSTHPCHTNSTFRAGLAIVAVTAAAAIALATGSALAAPAKGGAANIAMIGEPQTLDPMASTADLVGIIMQHVYEPLYTFDANWNVAPMLAESMPAISKDGLVYTIPLRKGVKFHNGKEMTSDDVVASLKRWMEMAPRGKAVAQGGQEPRGQGAERDRHHAQPALRAAARAPRAAERLRGDHGEGLDRHAADPVHRHRPVHVQGAQARPVRAAGALRRLQRAQASRPAATPASARRCSTSCASCRCPMPTRASKERSRGSTSSPTCCRSNRTRGSRAQRQREARADRAVRLSVPGAEHQAGAACQSRSCARPCRRRSTTPTCWAPASATRSSTATDSQPLRQEHAVLLDRRHRELRQGRRQEGRGAGREPPSTTARRSRSSPASSTTSTTGWRW